MRRARFTFLTVLLIIPASTSAAQGAPDWTRPPAVSAPRDYPGPPIERWRTPNGVEVLFSPRPAIRDVEVHLFVRAGGAYEGDGRSGRAGLLAAMLNEGGRGGTRADLRSAADDLGVPVVALGDRFGYRVLTRAPLARLDSALRLVTAIAFAPTLPDSALAPVRQRTVTTVLNGAQNVGTLALLGINHALYPADHPEGRPTSGRAPDLAHVTIDTLRAFHRATMQPANATVVVVGGATSAEVRALVNRHFASGWPRSVPVSRTALATPAPQPAPRIILVDRPGVPLSDVRVVSTIPRLSHPDRVALDVWNRIVSGTSESRVERNLSARGWAYEARSVLQSFEASGRYQLLTDIETPRTAEGIREILAELAAAVDSGVTAAEVAAAKASLRRGFGEQFLTTSAVAARLLELVAQGLPTTYYAGMAARIEAVTLEDVLRVGRRYAARERLQVVVAGDAAAITASLRALDFGTVELVPVEQLVPRPR